MNVGFFFVDRGGVDGVIGPIGAKALAASVRSVMPGVRVVQFTDEQTADVPGAHEVRRLPAEPLALLRLKHQAAVKGEWLFVDSDVIVQRDVRDVFTLKFDIALVNRQWPHLKAAAGFSERMPFNTGVVFSRSHKFWGKAYERLQTMPEGLQDWMGDQQVICDMVGSSRFKFWFLKGTRYNLPPSLEAEDDPLVRKAHIVHYKGPERKALLLARVRGAEPCA